MGMWLQGGGGWRDVEKNGEPPLSQKSVLQCAAVCCSVLQRVAACCSAGLLGCGCGAERGGGCRSGEPLPTEKSVLRCIEFVALTANWDKGALVGGDLKEGAWKWRAAAASEESVAVCCSVLPYGSVRCNEVLRGFWCTL